MASSGKKKTTMAKLNRENRQREKRAEKERRKDIRKRTGGDVGDGVGVAAGGENTEEAWQLTRGLADLDG